MADDRDPNMQAEAARDSQLKGERETLPLTERLARLAEKARRLAGPKPRDVTKDEMDRFCGQ